MHIQYHPNLHACSTQPAYSKHQHRCPYTVVHVNASVFDAASIIQRSRGALSQRPCEPFQLRWQAPVPSPKRVLWAPHHGLSTSSVRRGQATTVISPVVLRCGADNRSPSLRCLKLCGSPASKNPHGVISGNDSFLLKSVSMNTVGFRSHNGVPF